MSVGDSEGMLEGTFDNIADGELVGNGVESSIVGASVVGANVDGAADGWIEGEGVGAFDGACVGVRVLAAVILVL